MKDEYDRECHLRCLRGAHLLIAMKNDVEAQAQILQLIMINP